MQRSKCRFYESQINLTGGFVNKINKGKEENDIFIIEAY